MAGATFGRRGAAVENPEIAQRRAAFIAAERARAADRSDPPDPRRAFKAADFPLPPGAIVIREKSLGTAYALWLSMAQFGAHRFYLGYPASAACQTVLWFGSLWSLLTISHDAIYTLGAAAIWILGDALMMPNLHKSANLKLRRAAAASVFD